MKAELLKRLFRAIQSEPTSKVNNVLLAIIDDERKKGHGDLASQLDAILQNAPKSQNSPAPSLGRNLTELPRSSRSNLPLTTTIPSQLLRHHMVLRADIEQRFVRIEKEYAARGRLSKFGLNPRKKILLYGAPGCGKTLGAERLAYNTGLSLIKIRFDSIISSYFGESASNLRAVFESVSETPTLLLLDECDFVARSRNEGNDVGEVPRVVNTLLQLLDDYNAPGLLVATTNLQRSLDRAIFRRFDDVFEIPKPDHQNIEKLLRYSLSSLKVSKSLNWNDFSIRLDGASAAAVVGVAQNAAKICILNGNDEVKSEHLEQSILETCEARELDS